MALPGYIHGDVCDCGMTGYIHRLVCDRGMTGYINGMVCDREVWLFVNRSVIITFTGHSLFVCLYVCLFDLILYVSSTIFQIHRDGSSWVEQVLSLDKCVLLKDHNAVTPVRLEPAAPLALPGQRLVCDFGIIW